MRLKYLLGGPFLLFILLPVFFNFTTGAGGYVLKAQKYIRSGHYNEAIKTYKQFLKGNVNIRDRVRVYYHLSSLYKTFLNRFDLTSYYLIKIINEAEDLRWKIKAEKELASHYFSNTKDFSKALKIYSDLASYRPEISSYEDLNFKIALCYFHLGRYQLAQDVFEKILVKKSVSKLSPDVLFYLGLSHYYRENWKLSIHFWEEYLKLDIGQQEIVWVKFLLAGVYESLEEFRLAYGYYYSILRDYPLPEVVQYRLEQLYARQVTIKR